MAIDNEVTAFKAVYDTHAPHTVKAVIMLERIRSGFYKDRIAALRKIDDHDERDKIKKTLPCVAWAGIFTHRAIDGFRRGSGLLAVDMDDMKDVFMRKEMVFKHPSCVAVWVSPSGRGLHALFKVTKEINADLYKSLHFSISQELAESGIAVDPATSDISRVFYVSYDADIRIRLYDEVKEYSIKVVDTPEKLDVPEGYVFTGESEKEKKRELVVSWWLNKYGKPVEGNRNNLLFILACSLNRAGFSQNEIRLIIDEYASGLPPKELDSIARSAAKNVGEFNTLRFSPTANKNGDGDKFDFVNFATARGFRYSIIHDELAPVHLSKFVRVMSIDVFNAEITEEMKKSGISGKPLQQWYDKRHIKQLPLVKLTTMRDDKDKSYIIFPNEICMISAKGYSMINLIDFEKPLLAQDIVRGVSDDFKFKYTEEVGMFERFIRFATSGCDGETLNTSKCMRAIGYLCHSYNKSSSRKVVVFSDETGTADDARGGTGKGLIMQGIGKIRTVYKLDLSNRDTSERFIFSGLSDGTNIIYFDECGKNFNMKTIYSMVTDGINVEKKNKNIYTIEGKDMPKIVISTNPGISDYSDSSIRRRVDVRLTHYFNASHTPKDEFGCEFFDEWDDHEWNRFFSFMIRCIVRYLNYGIDANVEYTEKDFANIFSGSADTLAWVEDYVANNPEIVLKDFCEKYRENTGEHILNRTISHKLQMFFKIKNIKYEQRNHGGNVVFRVARLPKESNNDGEEYFDLF